MGRYDMMRAELFQVVDEVDKEVNDLLGQFPECDRINVYPYIDESMRKLRKVSDETISMLQCAINYLDDISNIETLDKAEDALQCYNIALSGAVQLWGRRNSVRKELEKGTY